MRVVTHQIHSQPFNQQVSSWRQFVYHQINKQQISLKQRTAANSVRSSLPGSACRKDLKLQDHRAKWDSCLRCRKNEKQEMNRKFEQINRIFFTLKSDQLKFDLFLIKTFSDIFTNLLEFHQYFLFISFEEDDESLMTTTASEDVLYFLYL